MRISPLLGGMLLSVLVHAEGSRELAPNQNIVVTGNNTTDVAALLIDNALYNSFASYTNPDPNSRLYIHIADPDNECIFLGFTFGHVNQTSQTPQRLEYEYRVRDPNGNIVFGPVTVPTTGGNIQGWSDANVGPMQIYGAGGYDATGITPADLTSQGWSGAGDYYIEFDYAGSGTGLLIDFWDISVADCSQSVLTEKTGRIWSYNWAIFAINDFGFPNRPFNGAYYVCAPDPDNPDAAFITKINFNGAGFRPAAFNIAFNSFGSMNTGNVMSDRRSVEDLNATQPEYPVFLNDPVDLCVTAEAGDIELLGISRCGATDFCIKYIASKKGQIDLLLDFDGPDDIYTPGSADVMIAIDVPADAVGKPTCVFWDGLDGLGNMIEENVSTAIPVVISYAQGIYHFPIYDAEFMTEGFMIEAIRPVGPQPLLYYDDSQISIASGSGEPAVQLTGCMPPCHRWLVFNDPDVPGFGNLNTINSWWFSQRILRSEVFFLPAYLECRIAGPESLCEGETTILEWEPAVQPEGSDVPDVVSVVWSGPDIIGPNQGSSVMIGSAGTYAADVIWLTGLGDTCMTSCSHTLTSMPTTEGSIDTLIISGETIEINGELYSEGGQFVQVLTGSNGCDSVLTIRITLLQTVVHFSLDNCNSYPSLGTDSVYLEFEPEYPDPLTCATLEATIGYRENPAVNRHSCTPGVGDSPAICISSLDDCTFAAGDEKAFVFEVSVTPATDTAVAVTGLSFFERGPEMYDWIDGPSGPNNYPTLYGVRVLKDGTEIFRAEDVPSTTGWSLETYDFFGNDNFLVDTTTVFRFELLGYCLVGNGAAVAAWDLDEISVQASCALTPQLHSDISGRIFTATGSKVGDVEIQLSEEPTFANPVVTFTNDQGEFMFPENPAGDPYYLKAYKNTDFLQGVSTIDLILIQKHLLGLKPFDSALQYLAADANNNHSVSALDMVDIRKLILGIYTELPKNTSWRFGKAGQILMAGNPWDLEETITIPSLGEDLGNMNFLGIKVGDVSGSINGLSDDIAVRSDNALNFSLEDRMLNAGERVRIDVTASNFIEIAGFQFAAVFNGATSVELWNGALDMTDMYAFNPDDQTLRVSWNTIAPKGVSGDVVLFSIIVETTTKGLLSSILALHPEILKSEAYTGEVLATTGVQIEVRPVQRIAPEEIPIVIAPNPFREGTTVRFYNGERGEVMVRVFDVSGMPTWEASGTYDAGEQIIGIPDEAFRKKSGIFFCQLRSAAFTCTVPVLRME